MGFFPAIGVCVFFLVYLKLIFHRTKAVVSLLNYPIAALCRKCSWLILSQSNQILCLSEWDYCLGLQKMLYLFTFELSTDDPLLMASLQKEGGGGSEQINHKRHASSA